MTIMKSIIVLEHCVQQILLAPHIKYSPILGRKRMREGRMKSTGEKRRKQIQKEYQHR